MTTKEQDRMLLLKAKAGDNNSLEELFYRYSPLVNKVARGYFLTNGDNDDLIQEGMIGLHKAFLSYDINSNASFATFAHLCITRQVQTAVRNSQNNYNAPLKNFLAIDSSGKVRIGDTNDNVSIYIESDELNPEDLMILKETSMELDSKVRDKLSKLEYDVFKLYLQGYKYLQIAKELGKDIKTVDNAIERIRKKLQTFKK